MGSYLQAPVTTKQIHYEQLGNMKYVSGQMQGWRIKMQDAVIHQLDIGDGNALFAVFDGHRGAEVSKYVANIFVSTLKRSDQYKSKQYGKALDVTFQKIDELIDSQQGNTKLKKISKQLGNQTNVGKISQNVGCTANVVLITKQKYYIANSGDSRSALCRNGTLVVFSQDHKPQDPIQFNRIRNAGGTVVNGRVNGGLNLTRAFGDFAYKRNTALTYSQQMITCKPDIKQIPINTTQDQFIVIGCDGIWQKFVDNTFGFVNLLRSQYKINKQPKKIMEDMLNMLLAKDTKTGLGCDNMSAIFITLK